ncbi:MAG: hypothetical protein WBB45_05285 [Cyclobacteriaceae bacterium]
MNTLKRPGISLIRLQGYDHWPCDGSHKASNCPLPTAAGVAEGLRPVITGSSVICTACAAFMDKRLVVSK